jgi:hypothetical protein
VSSKPLKLVFLLEEPSMKRTLEALLPKILPAEIVTQLVFFQGKQDLEKNIPSKLNGWRDSYHKIRFIVLRDNDGHPDCKSLKNRLSSLCAKHGHPDALIRLACQEMESWFLGDLLAIEKGLGRANLYKKYASSKKFRDPDHLGSPSDELSKLLGRYQKVGGARAIAPHLDPDPKKNNSVSYGIFIKGVQKLVEAA